MNFLFLKYSKVLSDGPKINNILPNHSVNSSKKNIPAINEDDFKPNLLHNREIEDLKQKIEEKKMKIDKVNRKIHESADNQKRLIEEVNKPFGKKLLNINIYKVYKRNIRSRKNKRGS